MKGSGQQMLMFSEVMKQARVKRGISLYELARRTGYTITALSNYEKGKRIPRFDAACKICEALTIKISVESEETK